MRGVLPRARRGLRPPRPAPPPPAACPGSRGSIWWPALAHQRGFFPDIELTVILAGWHSSPASVAFSIACSSASNGVSLESQIFQVVYFLLVAGANVLLGKRPAITEQRIWRTTNTHQG
jgi:hypothetical protein